MAFAKGAVQHSNLGAGRVKDKFRMTGADWHYAVILYEGRGMNTHTDLMWGARSDLDLK